MSAVKKFVPSNPGGKPGRMRSAGVVDYIETATSHGEKIAAFFVKILNGLDKRATLRDQIDAAKWLADRYMGKAVEVSLTADLDSGANPLKDLKPEQLTALIHTIAGDKSGARASLAAGQGSTDTSGAVGQPAETSEEVAPKPTGAE